LVCQPFKWHNSVQGRSTYRYQESRVHQKPNSSEVHERCWCSKCGDCIFSDHPTFDLVDVYESVLDGIEFKPGSHVNYAQSILPAEGGLPKFKNFPKELGGSGELMDE
tara:strand:+ start:1242 stop:1565 length:324 start_codon:yes stop_codon:yes gene_type:complete